jgi:prepilin-type N-terminal cleavage/methylation domain-containing protein
MFCPLFRRLYRDERGFTLIELMIVILVILILAGILIPQFGIARERARKASCVNNQRNLETAVTMWAIDNPLQTYVGGNFSSGATLPNYGLLTSGSLYATPALFHDPDDPSPFLPAQNPPVGIDYYLSQGSPTGGVPNPAAPSYGHVTCAYAADTGQSCGSGDPWVNCYEGAGPGTGLVHARGASASP